ncbi:hypothetical protein ABT297_11755 [Dactylosporangium sp. NPDC000555]|uniref:hypothetical protein n=1 Tax=Dactylosporangium sp. NPDC000555 TaxID=3154260 RepID=UPI00332D30F7
MTALLLAAYAVVLILVAGPRLARAGWMTRAPGLGIFAWQMWCAALLGCTVLIGAFAAIEQSPLTP